MNQDEHNREDITEDRTDPAPAEHGETNEPDPAQRDDLGEPAQADPTPAASEPAAEDVMPAPATERSNAATGAGGMIIGGVLAAAIGAAGALTFLPEGWRRGDTAVLSERIAALESRNAGISAGDLRAALDPIETRIAALESRSGPDLTPLSDRIAALEASPSGVAETELNAAIAALSQRLDQIESGVGDQARAAVDAALAEARARIDARAQELAAREETVADAQERIAARAALAELVAAAESGVPAPGALTTLTDHMGADPALTPLSEGLPTLAQLQDRFAPAARAALGFAAPEADAPLGDRLVSFLRSQTGARSLAPRDGDGIDAVLSRAEAALRGGDLPGTLGELDALSGASAQAMANWRADAEARLAALAALDEMQTRLSRNED